MKAQSAPKAQKAPKTQKAEPSSEVVAPAVVAPAVVAPAVVAPAKQPKVAKGKAPKPTEEAVAEPVAEVVATPATAPASKGKAKTPKSAPAVEASVATKSAPVVEGGAKATKAKQPKVSKEVKAKQPKAPKEAKAKAPKQPKVAKAPKQPKVAKAPSAEDSAEGDELDDGKRSFKAMLPGSDKFDGRYTGLTPYQAANKALSKYYRGSKEDTPEVIAQRSASEITFSIRESTRGSKRLVYTYNGRREKLKVPVAYKVPNKEELIIKEYKNRLTKIKKNESDATETATASA